MHSACNVTNPRHGRVARRGLARWTLAVLALLLWLASPGASLGGPGEYDVKAVFLLNFAKFVEWPPRVQADSNSPIVIGIVGSDPFGGGLERIIQNQTAQGRHIEVRKFKADEDLSQCHIVFLDRSVAAEANDIVKKLANQPVLTVSETDDFVKQGGMIGFAIVNKTVRFDINAKAAEAADLKVSSKLLAVARTVVKKL